jgi:D-glycero-alpha-D-manno-heptose-7-phosphate kinase
MCPQFGELLHQGWEYKKQLASGISNGRIDAMYQAARRAGAIGGKISGAGGGGFLLLYCPVECQDDVRKALAPLRELPFALERDGSKAIFNYRR